MSIPADIQFQAALQGLRRGDFSELNPLFEARSDSRPLIIRWMEQGRLRGCDQEIAEVLTCACFNGQTAVAEYLLKSGVPPAGGAGTGLNAIHWAANRGQLEVVRLLIRHKVPLETRSMYDATVIGTAVYAAVSEPRTEHHITIIEELLVAGALISVAGFPTGNKVVDSILVRHGASLTSER